MEEGREREEGRVRGSREREEVEEEELDPRVQEELEKLNNCTDEINRLEIQLDDANTVFRSLLSDSTHHLKALSKRIGSHIEKARPYYDTQDLCAKAQVVSCRHTSSRTISRPAAAGERGVPLLSRAARPSGRLFSGRWVFSAPALQFNPLQ